MISVMVVEDELPILRGICRLIETANSSFHVTRTAVNGKEAIEALQEEQFDLMFVDMQMPVLDGMEVLKYVKEKQISIYIIVLSGYQEFQYAREALQCGVLDYLLKPLKKDELAAVLQKVEQMIWKNLSKYETAYIKNNDEREFEAVLLTVGPYIMLREDYELTKCQDTIDEQLNFLLEKYISDDLRWIIPTQYENERIIVFRKLGGRTRNIAEKLYHDFKSQCGLITVIMAGQGQTHKTIFETNKRLHQLVKDAMGIEESRIMDEEEAKERAENGIHYLKTVRKDLLKIWVTEHIMDEIVKILAPVSERKVVFEVLKLAFFRLSEVMNSNYTYNQMEDEIADAIQNSYNRKELYERLEKLILKIFYVGDCGKNKEKLALDIKEYLDFNYQSVTGNKELAEIFGFVPAYIRDVFRSKYEKSPMEYLQELKLENARKLLVQESKLPVREIALSAGFRDALYFSKVFRKKFGITPSEYRNQVKKE